MLLVLAAVGSARAEEPRHRSSPRFVAVHDIRLPADRQAAQQRLEEHVGEHVEMDWLHVDELAELWPTGFIEVHGADPERCSGSVVDAEQVIQLGERAFGLLGLGRAREAQRRAMAAEERWACLGEYVPETTLQRSALAQAWAAAEHGDKGERREQLRQAAALVPSLPHYAAEVLPEPVQRAFHDIAADMERRPTSRVRVTAAGAPVDAYVDGRLLERNMGSGGTGRASTELAPGRHLIQFVRSGPHAESLVFEVGSASEVHIDVSTPVTPTEVAHAFERSLGRGELVGLLGGLIGEHPTGAPHTRVVLARAERRFGQLVMRLLPLTRTSPGRYRTDADLYSALEHTLDDESQAADGVVAPQPEERTTLGSWRLRTGLSAGPAFINGFVYGALALELSLETPVLVELTLRPELSLTNTSHTYALGGGGAYLAFCPRYERVRFGVGLGAVIRRPDHRFVGLRVHPSAEAFFGVNPVAGLWISVGGDVTLHKVYDGAIRFGLVYEFDLTRRPRKKRQAIE